MTLPDHTLTVGSHANIQAEISAKAVVIMGVVTGNVTAKERIEIRDFQKERRRPLLDEPNSPGRDEIGHIAFFVDGRGVLEKVRQAVSSRVGVEVDEAAEKPEEVGRTPACSPEAISQ